MSYYTVAAAKAECCSEGGGQHWTLSGVDLLAVTSGDLVIAGELVGVALTDYNVAADNVVIDLTGCHELPVTGADVDGNAAVAVGDWLFVNDNTGVINRDFTAGPCIGQAMDGVASGEVETICVKLWPNPWVVWHNWYDREQT